MSDFAPSYGEEGYEEYDGTDEEIDVTDDPDWPADHAVQEELRDFMLECDLRGLDPIATGVMLRGD